MGTFLDYRPPDKGHKELTWLIGLIKGLFGCREITTNASGGTFRSIGKLIRSGKSILLQKAPTKPRLKGWEDTIHNKQEEDVFGGTLPPQKRHEDSKDRQN